MLTSRLRLYTKNISYLRMLQGLAGLSPQDQVQKTEALIARYTGAKHAVLTSMGRMAMYEGLRALPKKGEIIITPVTVPEMISIVLLAGFTPVFCDLEPGEWNIDPAKVEALITDKTVAIVATHYYGNMNKVLEFKALCEKHGLLLIEDAAQAAGSWKDGRHAGTYGEFGILSFSYPKNVTSFYGGCLITNNDEIAQRARAAVAAYPPVDKNWLYKKVKSCIIMDLGTFPLFFQISARIIRYGYRHNIRAIMNIVTQNLNPQRLAEMPGQYLAQISPQQAQAIADKWPQVDEDVQHRIRCAEIYHRELSGLPQVTCPRLITDRSHTYLYFPIEVKDKYALQRFMIERGCDVAIQHSPNCADLDAYKPYHRDCPVARRCDAGSLMLPAWRGFPLEKAYEYAGVIRAYLSA